MLVCGYILFSLRWYTWMAFGAWVAVALIFYLVWGRRHSALNDGGDGIIAGAAAGEDGADLVVPPRDP